MLAARLPHVEKELPTRCIATVRADILVQGAPMSDSMDPE